MGDGIADTKPREDGAVERDMQAKVDALHAKVEAAASGVKDTNPKDAIGIGKTPLSAVPLQVVMEAGLGMMEGSLKYGRHNYREAGVRASVYFDATIRHLVQWFEGEDIDPDTILYDENNQPIPGSGVNHVAKAITSLFVLRDAMLNGMMTDDRAPLPANKDWIIEMNAKAKALLDRYPPEKRKAAYVLGQGKARKQWRSE